MPSTSDSRINFSAFNCAAISAAIVSALMLKTVPSASAPSEEITGRPHCDITDDRIEPVNETMLLGWIRRRRSHVAVARSHGEVGLTHAHPDLTAFTT